MGRRALEARDARRRGAECQHHAPGRASCGRRLVRPPGRPRAGGPHLVQRPAHRTGYDRPPNTVTRLVSAAALAALIAGLTLVSGSDAALSAPIKWSAFADLARPRAFAQAVALPTGETLVVGGLDRADADVTNPKTELLDPVAH